MLGISQVSQASQDSPVIIATAQDSTPHYLLDARVSSKKPFKYAVFGNLLGISDSYSLLEGILKDWSWDFGAKQYSFEIKPNAQFHNGRPVTAADVEFSLTRWFYMPRSSFEKMYVENIEL